MSPTQQSPVILKPSQEFTYIRTYSRWMEELKRREFYHETVDRYMDFMQQELGEAISPHFYKLGKQSILDMTVMPSMRAMWAAGSAAKFDSTTMYNCLAKETSFVTSKGIKSFQDCENGEVVQVPTHTGKWRNATVKSYGRQKLYKYGIRKGTNGKIHYIRATKSHRWILSNGNESNGLTVDDVIKHPPKTFAFDFDNAASDEKLYWCYGYVYGDGTKVKSDGKYKYSMVRLCGSDKQFAGRFEEVGFKTSTNDSLEGDFFAYTGSYLKTLPDLDKEPVRKISAFVAGYLSADGAKSYNNGKTRFVSIQCSNEESIKFLRHSLPISGHYIYREDDLTGQKTNLGIRPKTIRFSIDDCTTSQSNACWKVVSVEESEEEEVWCLEVEKDKSFILSSGILTGNCSYVVMDNLRSFSELLYILMCGTGVGFSVERQYTDQLPRFAKRLNGKTIDVVVTDDRKGWADGFLKVLEACWAGDNFRPDVSKVRSRGSRLLTMGGRASGPEPLLDLFSFVSNLFAAKRRKGQYKLNPIDVLDICNKAAEIVVVGGVRRSSEISFSDLDDWQVAEAKVGQFWNSGLAHRGMSNNSVAYNVKPDVITYTEEFLNLMKSGTGERGIYNREGAIKQMVASGRRETCEDVGGNPCIVKKTWIHTTNGPKKAAELIDEPFIALVDGEEYHSDGFFITGTKPVFLIKTKSGYEIEATDNHPMLIVEHLTEKSRRTAWKSVGDLKVGDLLCLNNHRDSTFSGSGSFEEGWLLGNLKGDGNTCGTTAYLDFWGQTKTQMKELAVSLVHSTVGGRSDLTGCDQNKYDKSRVQSSNLFHLAESYGITGKKEVTDVIEKTSSNFHRGFLRGWFDADGSVQGNQSKGISVRLSSIDLSGLEVAQRMLLRLGIVSTIYQNRSSEGYRELPNGKGGTQEYLCQSLHELVIANDNLFVFRDIVGFNDEAKTNKLCVLLNEYKRTPNRERFCDEVLEIIQMGEQEVLDCNVQGIHAFDANGLYAHNCMEILLRPMEFCNLSEVVIRPDDKLEDLKSKVKLAAMFGVWQSSFTNFPYLRPEWKKNCEEERLLGVSLTGIMDHPVLNNVNDKMKKWLSDMKGEAIRETERWCKRLDINMSAAITCVKPSGTVSQLVDSSSGIHSRYSQYYIRRYRISATDPLFRMLRDFGVPFHAEVGQEPSTSATMVLDFPFASPVGAKTRYDITAIEQLEHWKVYKYFWCEHNPSVTVYVGEDEWLKTLSWCYENFDDLCGIAFLPKSDHVYQLAPYEEIDKTKYEELTAKFPKIDYGKLGEYETEDNTDGAKTYGCVGDKCDI